MWLTTFSHTVPMVSPSFVNGTALRDTVTLNCNIQAVSSVSEDDIFWYKLDSDLHPSFREVVLVVIKL